MKKIFSIFLLSFFLNLIWENLHSHLYVHYLGQKITEFILMRASLVDAITITVISFPFLFNTALSKKDWLIILAGILIAISIELYALKTGRWAYNNSMPIIPILNIGLTPTIQLALTGYLSYWLVVKRSLKPPQTI